MSKRRTHRNLHHKRSSRAYKPLSFESHTKEHHPFTRSNIHTEIQPTVSVESPQSPWTAYPNWASDETIDYVNGLLGIYEPWETIRQERKAAEQRIADEASAFADTVLAAVRQAKENGTFDYQKVLDRDPDWASPEIVAEVNKLMNYPDNSRTGTTELVSHKPYLPQLTAQDEINLLRHQSETWEFVRKKRRFHRIRKAGKKVVGFAVATATLFGAYSMTSKDSSTASQSLAAVIKTIDSTISSSQPTEYAVVLPTTKTANNLTVKNSKPTSKSVNRIASINQYDSLSAPVERTDYSPLPWKFSLDTLHIAPEDIPASMSKALDLFNNLYDQDFKLINGQYINSNGQIMNQTQVEDFNFGHDSIVN